MARNVDSEINQITLEQYREALAAFLAGRSLQEVKQVADLSGRQLHALYYDGLPEQQRRKAQPSLDYVHRASPLRHPRKPSRTGCPGPR